MNGGIGGSQVGAIQIPALRRRHRREGRSNPELNLSALKGEDSQVTLWITTLMLAPEGSHRPHASGLDGD